MFTANKTFEMKRKTHKIEHTIVLHVTEYFIRHYVWKVKEKGNFELYLKPLDELIESIEFQSRHASTVRSDAISLNGRFEIEVLILSHKKRTHKSPARIINIKKSIQ